MVMTYTNKRTMDVIDMLNNNQIVSLNVHYDDSLGEENACYVFDYKTIADYPEDEHQTLKEMLGSSFVLISQVVKALEEFVARKEVEAVDFFELNFNIINKVFTHQKAYLDIATPQTSSSNVNVISELEKILSDNGILKTKVSGLYEQIPPTNKQQQRAKYVQVSYEQLLTKLKEVTLNGNIS